MANHEIVRPSELLAQLGEEYHRVKQHQAREAHASASRRRIENDLERIAQRFERVLSHWSAEEDKELRATWRKHLYEGGPAPRGPEVRPPRLFIGETDGGAHVEIRPASDGGHDIVVDGTLTEHSAAHWRLGPDAREPFAIGQHLCRERFEAPQEAIRALQRFVATDEALPPWRWARELFEDGLIDSEFGLTQRGRRALVATDEPDAGGAQQAGYCVIAADAGRARILTLEAGSSSDEAAAHLVEVADLSNPARRTRDSDLFSDTRPGLRREGAHGPRHAVDDGRDRQRDESDKKFAEQVAEQAEAAWCHFAACHIVVVAPPKMLGILRPVLARHQRGVTRCDVDELDRDLSRLAPSALHDALAEAQLLPPRGRATGGNGNTASRGSTGRH
jgi:protein required for attachment to host cells